MNALFLPRSVNYTYGNILKSLLLFVFGIIHPLIQANAPTPPPLPQTPNVQRPTGDHRKSSKITKTLRNLFSDGISQTYVVSGHVEK